MSDRWTLFPVNRNNFDLYLVINFTHSQTTRTESARREVILSRDVCLPSKASWSKGDLRDWERHFNILTLLTLYPPVHPSSEVCCMGCRWATCWLWSVPPSPTLLMIQKLGWPASNNYSEMLSAEGLIHAGIWHIILFFSYSGTSVEWEIPFSSQNRLMVQGAQTEWIYLFS